MAAARAVDMVRGAIVRAKRAGGSADTGIGRTSGRHAPGSQKRGAFHSDQRRAENRYSGIAHDLDRIRGGCHPRRRRLEDDGAYADDRHRAQALQKRRAKRDHQASPQGALVGKHIGGNHRLAVTGTGGMKNSVAETESDESPGGAAAEFRGSDRGAEQTVKPRFLGQDPAHNALRAGNRALIGTDREGMMHALPQDIGRQENRKCRGTRAAAPSASPQGEPHPPRNRRRTN